MDLTSEQLRQRLEYDPATGMFTWRQVTNNRVKVGERAGTVAGGYVLIRIDGICHKAHRLAWLYMTGKWPSHFIDHINGARDDNRICNLREATQAQNKQNAGKRKNNTSGFKGVSFNKSVNKWQARISTGMRSVYLGSFANPKDAHAAYCRAAEKYHREFAHS